MTERTEVLRSTLPAAALLRFAEADGGLPDRPLLGAVDELAAREVDATSVVSSPWARSYFAFLPSFLLLLMHITRSARAATPITAAMMIYEQHLGVSNLETHAFLISSIVDIQFL